MLETISLQCSCGKLRGTVKQARTAVGPRLVCYCDDCQTYAHFLGRSDILDAHGGTDLVALRPASMNLTEGRDQLRCMRLAATGMFRWYAGCCRTPISNSIAPGLPFAATHHNIMDGAIPTGSRDTELGPVRIRMHGRYAIGQPPAGTHPKVPPKLPFVIAPFVLGGLVRGAAQPSPFFDAVGKPVVTPEILPPEERKRLLALCGPQTGG